MAKLLVIISQSPFGSSDSADAMDFALASTGYGHDCSVLLSEQGVRYLLHSGANDALHLKDPRKQLNVLPFYDIEELYVCAASLEAINLDHDLIPAEAALIKPDDLASLVKQHDFIVSF